MSDTKQESKPVVAAPPAINWDVAKTHITKVKAAAELHAGKPGHNPYFWIKDNVSPLEKQLADLTKRTPALYDAILKLPTSPDVSTAPPPTNPYPKPLLPPKV